MKTEEFAFCTATSFSLGSTHAQAWHIRRLSDAGRLHGAKIDTESLCGKLKEGFDIATSINIDELHRSHLACKTCAREFYKLTKRGSDEQAVCEEA